MRSGCDFTSRRVLVLDGELRSSLAVTRSLGRMGATLFVGASTTGSLAAASKFVSAVCQHPSPDLEEVAFIDRVAAFCRLHAVTDLLAQSEITLATVLRNRERFAGIYLPYVRRDTYELAVDKHRLAELAATIGIRSPQSIRCDDRAAADAVLALVRYPAVLKPVQSRVFADGRWWVTQVQYAADEGELRDKLSHHPQYRFPFMIQEFVKGEGKGVFLLCDQGRTVARFAHRRIREKPPTGGVSVLSESSRADEGLFDQAARLLQRLEWHGVAMVEFKVTADNVPYLMEINPRFWGSLQLAIDSGVDFPTLLLAMRDHELQPRATFTEGVRLRWLLGDLDHLLIVAKSSRYSPRRKLCTLVSFLNFFSMRTRYETFRWNDPMPFFTEISEYFRALRRKR